MDKKASKYQGKKRGTEILTKDDLTKIRTFLPRNWRFLIHQRHAGISLRQITEVFHQRTNNPEDNKIVWTTINEALKGAGQKQLAEKVKKRISFSSTLYKHIQKECTRWTRKLYNCYSNKPPCCNSCSTDPIRRKRLQSVPPYASKCTTISNKPFTKNGSYQQPTHALHPALLRPAGEALFRPPATTIAAPAPAGLLQAATAVLHYASNAALYPQPTLWLLFLHPITIKHDYENVNHRQRPL